VTPVWGASTGCAACHKNSVAFGVYSAPATGAHTKHLALAGALCNQCHAGAVANVSGGIDHNDGVVDVTNGYPAVTRHAAGTYSGTCTSAACHANPYGAGSVTTPTWGATGCVACHSAGFTATGPATGSHALHITACTSCHATGTSETTAPTLANGHNDGNIDIVGVGYPPNATKHAAGTGYSSCATATCHGSISPVWGANTANDTCTKCHGTPTSTGVISNAANNRYLIAPFGTLSSNVSNNPKIGAHQTHLKFSNGFSNYSTVTFRCENCHGTLPVSGSHANGTSAPAFQGLAIQGGMTSAIRRPAFNTANLTCSNTYCHNPAASNVLKMAANTGSALFPSWTSAKYIDTTSGTKTNANCNKCHKVPGDSTFSGFTAAFRHTGLTIANDCSICHGHNGDAAGTIGNRHIDGILRGLDCNGCHGLPPSTKAGKAAGYGITFNEASTAHVSHAGGGATNYQFTCDQCHKGNDHMTGTFTDVFKSPATTLAGSSATYTSPTCTNVYCHSSGNGTYKGAVTTIAWGNNKDSIIGLADQAVRCATCHDTTTYSASHDKHINITTGKGYGCVTCHAATVSNNTTLLAAAKLTNGTHVNAVKDVQFSGVSPAVGTNCATVYCHSNGKGAAPVITPVWGIATGACGACHLTAASTPALATGSHTTHFTVIASTDPTVVCVNCHTYTSETAAPHVDGTLNVTTTGCDTCHADPYGAAVTAPAWGTSASGCASCHKGANAITATGPATGSHAKHTAACISCHAVGTTATTAPTLANGHTDGNIDVIGVGYTLNKVKGSAYTTCSNASCHADPYGTSILVTPVWGTVSGCAACHKNSVAFGVYSAPATGAHTKHLALAGAACNQCHAGAVANFNGGTSHANGTVNVSGTKATYPDTAKHAAGTYSNNCTTACHGQGKPVWGASYTDGSAFPYSAAQCGKCHSESGTVTVGTPFYSTAIPKVTLNTNAKVGAHTAHLTASDSLHPALNCSDCHGTVNLNDATHLNGVTNFNWSTLAKTGGLTPSYNATTGVCSNVYCHGGAMPGGDTSGTNRTPAWNNANYLPATLSVAGCSTCHGFPPPPSVGHPPVTIPAGFPATAKLGTTCSCHGNIDQQTSAPNTYANIFVDKNLHINGILEGGACNDCHGYPPVRSGFAGAGVQNNWSSAKLQNYSGGGGAHTIDNHVSKTANKNDGFANCVNCHSPADHLTNPTEFKPSQNIKVQINQRFRMEESKQARYSSNRLDGNAHVPGNCSNISCHFGASPAWNER
jgi:predicted CxxxxCH...CXXCH cytochrome family protein